MRRGNTRRGVLSERPVSKILLVLGVLLVLLSLLTGSSSLTGIGWAAILASAVIGAFFNA